MLAMQRGQHASYYGVMIWVVMMLEQWLKGERVSDSFPDRVEHALWVDQFMRVVTSQCSPLADPSDTSVDYCRIPYAHKSGQLRDDVSWPFYQFVVAHLN
jgi:hypothetical protein